MMDDNNFDDELDEFKEEDVDDERNLSTQSLERNLLIKLFNDDIDDQDILFTMADHEDLPQLALKKEYVYERRFNYLRGLINLLRRLACNDDSVLDQWMGITEQQDDDGQIISILSFMFNITDHYYDQFCMGDMIELEEMCFSLYDYLCSVICAFIMTLTEEQLNVAEEVLFENMFSSSPIRALLASDIICFMCRTSQNMSFIQDIFMVVFSFVNELYLEDVHFENNSRICDTTFSRCHLTQEILLNLCNRLLTYLSIDETKRIRTKFPLEKYSFLWKRMQWWRIFPKLSTSWKLDDSGRQCQQYDQLCMLSGNKPDLKLYSSLVELLTCQFNSQYHTLLCVRLLSNCGKDVIINHRQMNDVIRKIRQILFANDSSSPEHKLLVMSTLRLVHRWALGQCKQPPSESLLGCLCDLMLTLHELCSEDYILKQYFFIALHNLCVSKLFEPIIASISNRFSLQKDFKLHLKYTIAGKFMSNEERELYIDHVLKKNYAELCEQASYESSDHSLTKLILLSWSNN